MVLTTHFGWVPVLARLLEPYLDVRIVVHSTWRYEYDLDELREMLGTLGHRLVATTPGGQRFESIRWWLQMNPSFSSYRILDDAPHEFPVPPPAELIVCEPASGVSAPDAQALLKSWLDEGGPKAGG
jgi:hypothetical protein